ncbi:hypothetical protein K4G92_23035, partial [Mycobacterium tuberculosis]|nr:hypothetical protein [Mycobacterium tuberculosis]
AYAAQQGLSWQVVLDAVRQQGQRIWQALSVAERQRFLRHLRHYWDVHRYRVAPQVAEVLEGLIQYTAQHFAYEEELFAKYAYAESAAHVAE